MLLLNTAYSNYDAKLLCFFFPQRSSNVLTFGYKIYNKGIFSSNRDFSNYLKTRMTRIGSPDQEFEKCLCLTIKANS